MSGTTVAKEVSISLFLKLGLPRNRPPKNDCLTDRVQRHFKPLFKVNVNIVRKEKSGFASIFLELILKICICYNLIDPISVNRIVRFYEDLSIDRHILNRYREFERKRTDRGRLARGKSRDGKT